MDKKLLQKEVNQIKMTKKIEEEILSNCYKELEEKSMSKNNMKKFMMKPMAAVAAFVLCVCLTGTTAMAATGKLEGFFTDIKNWTGAVTGTAYEQADDEVEVNACVQDNELSVTLTMVEPKEAPYFTFESMGIKAYQIKASNGEVVMEGAMAEAAVLNGEVIVKEDLSDLAKGEYTLIITELVGSSKADQPLTISGSWECKIVY